MRKLLFSILVGTLLFTTVPTGPAGAAPSAAAQSEEGGCDPDFVQRTFRIWNVLPNGSDDTANIECAMAEVTANNGLTVRLAPGTFYVDFFSVDGFNARFRGAGRDDTTIQPLEGGLDCVSDFEDDGVVVWMAFTNSDLTITDLGLNIPDVACAEPYDGFVDTDPETGEEFGFSAEDFNAMVVVASRSLEPTEDCGITGNGGLNAQRLRIVAPVPDFTAPIFNPQGAFNALIALGSAPMGCEVRDQLIADVLVRDVYAEGVGNLIETRSITDSKIKAFFNHTVDVDLPVILSGDQGSVSQVYSNLLEGVTGVGVVSANCSGPGPGFCQARSSKVSIFRNEIHMSPIGFAGIVAVNGDPGPPIVDNRLFDNFIVNAGNVTGVFMLDADGDRVAKNTFAGASVFAVLVEGATTNSKIVSNDMTDHTAFEAGILLVEGTSFNKVRRNDGATVIDLGTDNDVVSEVEAPAAPLALGLSTQAAEPTSGPTSRGSQATSDRNFAPRSFGSYVSNR